MLLLCLANSRQRKDGVAKGGTPSLKHPREKAAPTGTYGLILGPVDSATIFLAEAAEQTAWGVFYAACQHRGVSTVFPQTEVGSTCVKAVVVPPLLSRCGR